MPKSFSMHYDNHVVFMHVCLFPAALFAATQDTKYTNIRYQSCCLTSWISWIWIQRLWDIKESSSPHTRKHLATTFATTFATSTCKGKEHIVVEWIWLSNQKSHQHGLIHPSGHERSMYEGRQQCCPPIVAPISSAWYQVPHLSLWQLLSCLLLRLCRSSWLNSGSVSKASSNWW